MQVMVELSLCPLVNEYIPPIQDFIDRLNSYGDITVTTCSTSTQVTGGLRCSNENTRRRNAENSRRSRAGHIRC